MTNEEAIEELMYLKHHERADSPPDKALDMAIESLKQNQWIPCSERLPEVGKEVLVTVWDGVKIAHFNIRWADGEQEWCFEEFDLNGEDFNDVKAWCELPEPYEGRTE